MIYTPELFYSYIFKTDMLKMFHFKLPIDYYHIKDFKPIMFGETFGMKYREKDSSLSGIIKEKEVVEAELSKLYSSWNKVIRFPFSSIERDRIHHTMLLNSSIHYYKNWHEA